MNWPDNGPDDCRFHSAATILSAGSSDTAILPFHPPLALLRIAFLAIFFGVLAACTTVPGHPVDAADDPQAQPELASGVTRKAGTVAERFMVSAANPLAVEAGVAMLRRGGSAVDAAIAVQMVLTLVEPQSSGIGGGAFLLHFDGSRVQAYDGRETAPAGVSQTVFQRPDGTSMPFFEAVVSGRSVGVPGVLRMLELAHRTHGRLPWETLFVPAIRLAEEGFAISPRLATLLAGERYLHLDGDARALFYDTDGKPHPAGHRLENPQLAQTLRRIAREGSDAFYQGKLAEAIAGKVRSHPSRPGTMTAADLASYRAVERPALCSPHRSWTICGMPPPSAGGVAVIQMLGILDRKGIDRFAPADGQPATEAVHRFAEAGRLAFADRGRFIADLDFAPLPAPGVDALIDPDYVSRRAELIGETSMGRAAPGQPFAQHPAWRDGQAPDQPSTSQISVVDSYGNGLSMTTSIENAFGSRQMIAGFLLNNQLTDFSFDATDEKGEKGEKGWRGPVANRIEPGKRPRSAMSPTLVFDRRSGALVMTLGSPGGPPIINYVAKALVGVLHWNLDLQQAFDLPNFGSRNGPTELERGRFSPGRVAALEAKGHAIRLSDQTSGLQGIMRRRINGREVWFGAADPRREGVARGD